MKDKEVLICPICKERLVIDDKTAKCKNNHSFDVAKEGYINLLPVNKKNSLSPGENKAQVIARREFLNKGYFSALLDGIKDLLKDKSGVLLDAGCGTGYYSNGLNDKFSCIGIDISKEAVLVASKSTDGLFIVSSVFEMPVKSNSVDVILNIFSPKPTDEFRRVLKDDGVILEVIPNTYHMIELKDKLYKNVYLNDADKKELKGLSLVTERKIKYKKQVSKADVKNLLEMTPYAFSGRGDIGDMEITFDFIIKLWSKK